MDKNELKTYLPDGLYLCMLSRLTSNSESSGGVKGLKLTFKIAAGPYRGRTFYIRHLYHPAGDDCMIDMIRFLKSMGLGELLPEKDEFHISHTEILQIVPDIMTRHRENTIYYAIEKRRGDKCPVYEVLEVFN